jgi:uncharacterized protein YndB with AHSA1/START domain
MSEDVAFARVIDAPRETMLDAFTAPDGQPRHRPEGDRKSSPTRRRRKCETRAHASAC